MNTTTGQITVGLAALRRVRWAVRAALTFGVAASVAANVLHARPNPISQTIAAWPPLALLLTVELVSRVPVGRRWLGVARVAATVVIAGIAGWVSYWHMSDVASRYGENPASAYLLPISVDGLIVVASICLVELAGRLRTAETGPTATPSTVDIPVVGPDAARPTPPGAGVAVPAGTDLAVRPSTTMRGREPRGRPEIGELTR